jgi:TM2 domain-containing membrane protein YozV
MKKKSSGMAYLWWLIGGFGIFGIHRFYLGHIGMGVLYLFTGGLFCIGAFIDLFRIPSMVKAKNNEFMAQEAMQMSAGATAAATAATARADKAEAEARIEKAKQKKEQ